MPHLTKVLSKDWQVALQWACSGLPLVQMSRVFRSGGI